MLKNLFDNKDFSKISIKFLKNIFLFIVSILIIVFIYICIEIYLPLNSQSKETIFFTIEKGWGNDNIADALKEAKIIRSSYFFKFYTLLTLKHSDLKAGEYILSSNMPIRQIANIMAKGSVIREKIVIPEGWNKNDIGEYLQKKGICEKKYFLSLIGNDYSESYDFLKDKPKDLDLDGYLFPDTYEISKGTACEEILNDMLTNFGRKITQEMRNEIRRQKKTVFDIITMASMIEKEVISLEDKKIVSGILWKRMVIGMPLQIDATIVYITGKSKVSLSDTKIDSPYNTYAYYGLPKGPISNPGLESIIAAMYPQQSKYFYYLTSGKTIFSETLEEHNRAKWEYLK